LFIFLAPPPEVKIEPVIDYPEPQIPIMISPSESNKSSGSIVKEVKKVQRDSMIAVRKDYSYKYSQKIPTTPTTRERFFPSSPTIASSSSVQSKSSASLIKLKRTIKPQISILERHDYDKSAGPSKPKLIKMDNKPSSSSSSHTPANSAISATKKLPSAQSHVPIKQSKVDQLKVVVAQKVESPVLKLEPVELKSPTLSEQKDPQNINKINNKINIIFQLNDNTKSLRKNIILHRRAPKKMVQKITIKETNNNSEEANVVPDKVLCSIDTQTEHSRAIKVNLTTTNPLNDEPTEHLFFDDDVLISLQQSTISFFEFNRLNSLLKKGEPDFKLIDRIPRRLHDTLIDSDNKFQRLCYNEQNSFPIYVEMRAKQKELDDPDMCPIAFLYCNIYYIDQRRAKFSSVHLDTVKSVIADIIYTTVPGTSYFIMAWNEKLMETKTFETGIVKYKLTPNLDLAKLASIRQFPKLNYCTKQINCGDGEFLIEIELKSFILTFLF
jgi:hypothetical protein